MRKGILMKIKGHRTHNLRLLIMLDLAYFHIYVPFRCSFTVIPISCLFVWTSDILALLSW